MVKKISRSGVSIRKTDARTHLSLLGRLSRIFHSSLNPKIILETVLIDTVRLLDATSGSLVLVNPESGTLEIEASYGLSRRGRQLTLRVGQGITGWVAFHGNPALVPDVRKDPRYIPARSNIRSELAVPVYRAGNLDQQSQILGVLNVDSTQVNAFHEDDQKLLLTIASQISGLIQNAWLYQQSRQRADQLDKLLRFGQSIMNTETFRDCLDDIVRGVSLIMGTSLCAVFLLDDKGENLRWSATSRKLKVDLEDYPMAIDNTQMGMVVRRNKPIHVQDIRKADPFPFKSMPQFDSLVSLLAVPLLHGGKVLGALAVFTDKHHLFSNDEVQILNSLGSQSALAIQKCLFSDRLVSTEEHLRQSERLSSIGLLAAEVAHEIRNPLTVMKMLIHSMEKETSPDDTRRKDYSVLIRKMDQMNHTVERVLNLARKSEPHFEIIPLNSILEDLALLIRHKTSQQQIQLKLTLASPSPTASVDRSQMEQALLNVILNALQAMPKGGVLEMKTGIQTSRKHLSGTPWIEVRDNGHGMPAHIRKKLAEPFLTTRISGTGLGMAIVDKIIKSHGGQIQVRSKSNRGTVIRVSLPASSSQALN